MFASIVLRHHFHRLAIMNPDTYTFTGDAVTFLGLLGVVSTGIIVFTAFRRYFHSPLRK